MSSAPVLLVSPSFHGYWRAISAAFESIGYPVIAHCYDGYSSWIDRAQNKLRHDLPRRAEGWLGIGRPTPTERAISVLRSQVFAAVVVVKGDELEDSWWEALEAAKVPRITWLYDEVRRTRFSDTTLFKVGPVASYSRQDVHRLDRVGLEAHHVALGFDSLLEFSPIRSESVSLVGARYKNREELALAIQDAGVPIRAYGREWSRRPWDVLRTRRFSDSGVPAVSDLTRSAAYGVMSGSLATLNVHADQDGFTMRTFEAAGVAGLQLIDRTDVSEFYDVGSQVLTFTQPAEAAAHAERASRDPRWADAIRRSARRRSLAEHTLVHRARSLESLWA